MKLVVDTNVLFTYFWKNSFSRSLLVGEDLVLFSPEYSLEEIRLHKKEIIRKTGISEENFENLLEELKEIVDFIPINSYASYYGSVINLPDKDDLDFLTLAFKLGIPIWSNDVHFKKQSLVKVYTTSELVNALEM